MRLTAAPRWAHLLLRAWARRLRYRTTGRQHAGLGLRAAGRCGVVFAFWHQHLLMLMCARTSRRMAALISRSRDGALIADLAAGFGVRAIRGSSHRGGAQAAGEALQAVREGWHLAVTVDGPRGPLKVPKPGAAEIARVTGAALVPVAARASCEWRIRRSWDRFRVPLPGARIAVVYGEPVPLPPHEPTPEELAALLARLQDAILACEREAARRVGRSDLEMPAGRP